MDETYKPQAKTISQLAAEYKVSQATMRKWLKVAKLNRPQGSGYLYTPAEVKEIYTKLGEPYKDN